MGLLVMFHRDVYTAISEILGWNIGNWWCDEQNTVYTTDGRTPALTGGWGLPHSHLTVRQESHHLRLKPQAVPR